MINGVYVDPRIRFLPEVDIEQLCVSALALDEGSGKVEHVFYKGDNYPIAVYVLANNQRHLEGFPLSDDSVPSLSKVGLMAEGLSSACGSCEVLGYTCSPCLYRARRKTLLAHTRGNEDMRCIGEMLDEAIGMMKVEYGSPAQYRDAMSQIHHLLVQARKTIEERCREKV